MQLVALNKHADQGSQFGPLLVTVNVLLLSFPSVHASIKKEYVMKDYHCWPFLKMATCLAILLIHFETLIWNKYADNDFHI